MLCILCLQCMLMLSMCIYVCLLPFGSGRRLELIPGRCLPQKVYVRACTSTLAPEQRFIPRHHPLAALAAQSARGFQAPTPLHTTAHFCFLQQLLAGQPGIHKLSTPE